MKQRDARPLRTLLFVPGDQAQQVRDAAKHGADAVMIDLEEPRTPFPEAERTRARGIVREFLSELEVDARGPLYFARVEPVMSGHILRDLEAVMHPGLSGILLPKITAPSEVVAADAMLTCMEVEHDLARGSKIIYPILETAQALRCAYEIAMASPRVRYLGGAVSRFGDIHQALGYRWTPHGTETLFLRSKVLMDARAAGIRYPISGMWGGDVDDIDGLRAWATQLRDLGYYGMMIGRPEHVPHVHDVFTPTREEIEYWKTIAELAERSLDEGPATYGSPNQGEGHVVHIAHVGSARLNLEWARALGLEV